MFAKTGTWQRDIVALRVMPIAPNGALLSADQPLDAGWLVRRGARIAAVGMVLGQFESDGDDLHIRNIRVQSQALSAACDNAHVPGTERPDPEAALLRSTARQIDALCNPLIVTCGGRGLDLPLLRYRALAHRISLAALHLAVAGRLIYFNRYDSSWHLDLCDLLACQGASMALRLEDLCLLQGQKWTLADAVPETRAIHESAVVFSLFLDTLRLMGRLLPKDGRVAEEALLDAMPDVIRSTMEPDRERPGACGKRRGGGHGAHPTVRRRDTRRSAGTAGTPGPDD